MASRALNRVRPLAFPALRSIVQPLNQPIYRDKQMPPLQPVSDTFEVFSNSILFLNPIPNG